MPLEEYMLESAADTLSAAFFEDPMWKKIFPDLKKRKLALKRFFSVYIRYCYNYEEVDVVLGDKSHQDNVSVAGVAIWVPPSLRFSLWRMLKVRGLKIINSPIIFKLSSFARVLYYLIVARDKFTKNKKHYYFDFFAVHPAYQGKGIGKMLLSHKLQKIDEHNYYAFLETMNEANISFYNKFGFKLIEDIYLKKEEFHIYPMLREPRVKKVAKE
ncbi:MAG: GNAT family N-acetyltransferase [Candidatus Helarchaeota archaeon]